MIGLFALDFTNRTNAVTVFFPLAPFAERQNDPSQSGPAILAALQKRVFAIRDALVVVVPPPPVQGIGNAGGFKLEVEDRRSAGLPALQEATDHLIERAGRQPGLSTLFTSFRSNVPQLYLDIDRKKAQTLNVPVNSVFSTLQTYLGSTYVNDFNFLGRTYEVYSQ